MKLLKISICTLMITMLSIATASAQTISGQVRNAAKSPHHIQTIQDVTVYVRDNPEIKTKTDKEGRYTLKNAPDDGFIVFEKKGFETDMKKINGSELDMSLCIEGLTTISDKAFFYDYMNLDYPGLEKVKEALEKNDILLAKYELIEYYRNRTEPYWGVTPKRGSDWKKQENFSNVQYENEYNHIYAGYDINNADGTMNWEANPYNDNEFKWGLNRMFTLRHMAVAYEATHDSKYAYEYQAECIDWVEKCPKPICRDVTGTWRTIEIGIKNHYCMPDAWYLTLYADEITTESRIIIIKSAIEHMEYLSMYSGSNNWMFFEARGLYTLALLNPEFKKSEYWGQLALSRADSQLKRQFKPDGWHQEQTLNYHMESANALTEIEKVANQNNVQTVMTDSLIKAYDIENHFSLPGIRPIALNDTNSSLDFHSVLRGRAQVVSSYEKRRGADYLFTSSDYRLGTPAENEELVCKIAGNLTMRDYWGRNSTLVYFEGGPSGQGHGWQSRDMLQVVVASKGREMLIEPSIYNYTGEPIPKYFYTSTAHNVALVDGEDQVRRERGMDAEAENFVAYTSQDFDYTTGFYHENFGETTNVKVNQKRKVSFDKNGIVFVTDEFTGDGKHDIIQNWNIAQCKTNLNAETGKFVGTFGDGTGIMLIPLDEKALFADIVEGCLDLSSLRGLVYQSSVSDCEGLQYHFNETDVPLNISTAIIPFEGKVPDVKTTKLECGEGNSCISLKINDNTLYYLTNHEGKSNSFDKFEFDGETAIIRCDSVGAVIDVKKYPENSTLKIQGKEITTPSLFLKGIEGGEIIKGGVTLYCDGASDGTISYYMQNGEEITKIGEAPSSDKFVFDTTNLPNSSQIKLWAEWTNGLEKRKSRVLEDIDITNYIDATSKISLSDRRFVTGGSAYAIYDDTAHFQIALACGNGDSVKGTVKSSTGETVKISAKATSSESAEMTVIINGTEKVVPLKSTFEEYEITKTDGDYSFEIKNSGDKLISLNYLRNEHDGIKRENDKVFRNRFNCTEGGGTCNFGDGSWNSYKLTFDMYFSHIYSAKKNGGLYFGGAEGKLLCYVKPGTNTIDLAIKNGAAVNVMASANYNFDTNTWYSVEYDLTGTDLKVTVWKRGDEKPNSPTAIISNVSDKAGYISFISAFSDCSIDNIIIKNSNGEDIYSNDMEDALSGGLASGFSGASTWAVEDILGFTKNPTN